jgi:hypothetical protein
MPRPLSPWVLLVAFLCAGAGILCLGPSDARSEDEGAPKGDAASEQTPALASDEEAQAALKVFQVDFKARGKKGDEKIAEQDWAMRELAKVQHKDVVDALAKVTRNRSVDLRTAAVLQLGRQRALPGYAGEAVTKAMAKNTKDATFLMAGLEAIGSLRYLGASELLVELMRHHDYAVQKNALVTMGALKDTRFLEEIVKLMKALRLEKGAKWDGVTATHDTGTAGDHDQKAAEAAGKAAEAKNKQKGKRAARSSRDLGPVVLEVAKALTGQEFTGSINAREWMAENKAELDKAIAEITKLAEAQQAAGK